MDWSKIKTIFIVVFFILNIFLLTQLISKINKNQYEVISDASLEEKLKGDDIEYVNMPKGTIEDQHISAKSKKFKESELKNVKKQEITVEDDYIIYSTLEEPVRIGKEFDPSQISAFIHDHVLYGEKYRFWEHDEEENTIIYYQEHEEKLFLKNMNGRLVFYLNDENEIISYEQTMLEDIEPLREKQEVIPAMKAVELLHEKGKLKPDSKITSVELGYYTIVQLTGSQGQVLTPTWHFIVEHNGEKEPLLVNAFEGRIISQENE